MPQTTKPSDHGVDAPRKKIKKSKKRQKSAAKRLQLPEAPHDRLQTLRMRLGLPKPTFVVTKREEYRAVIDGDKNEVNGNDVVWYMTAREAKMHAAAQACPALEAMLMEKVVQEREGQETNANTSEVSVGHPVPEEVEGGGRMLSTP